MPATITHSLFSEDLLDKLNKDTKKSLLKEKKSFIMFSQSTDPVMFYNILSLKSGKNTRQIQYTYHSNKSSVFFSKIIKYIKEKHYYEKPIILAFLYGFISHYYLDSYIHPYVYYKTGDFNKHDKKTYKYNCEHHFMETYIDNYMLKKKNIPKYNMIDECFDIKKFSPELNDIIDYSFDVKDFSKKYYKALKDMRLFIKLFRVDKYGIKKRFYKLVDKITPKSFFVLESLSYNNYQNKNDYLNEQHATWINPWDPNNKSSKSFDELYNDSLKEAIKTITIINEYFFNNKSINIKKLFKQDNHIGKYKNREPIFEF